ncbi:hypothetical protein ACGLFO_07555, partial [Corynebacterium hesseae]|uniref:hypothetical protein n=1 Tax=Corynebacterium hesseae TaxID=2913502 RepID=UPI00373EBBCA
EEGVDAIVLLSQISKEDTTRVMEENPELAAALREENEAQSPEEVTYTADGRPIVAPRADYGTLVHLDITVDRSTQENTVKVVNHPVNPSLTANEEWKTRSEKLYGELDRQLGEQLGTGCARTSSWMKRVWGSEHPAGRNRKRARTHSATFNWPRTVNV